jgi:hypothetical protein
MRRCRCTAALVIAQPQTSFADRRRFFDAVDAGVVGGAIRSVGLLPVFASAAGGIGSRRAALLGWVFGTMAVDQLMQGGLAAGDGGMSLRRELLFATAVPLEPPSARRVLMPLHGSVWTLSVAAPSGALADTGARGPRWALVVGVLISSAALFVLFWRLAGARNHAAALADALAAGFCAHVAKPVDLQALMRGCCG